MVGVPAVEGGVLAAAVVAVVGVAEVAVVVVAVVALVVVVGIDVVGGDMASLLPEGVEASHATLTNTSSLSFNTSLIMWEALYVLPLRGSRGTNRVRHRP